MSEATNIANSPHIRPMVARSGDDTHRAATPLELLFDLVSVIAIAAAANGLHHAIIENHTATGLISFAMAFFSILWAWMHFTWFATSYDNDDVVYRLAVFVMMFGSLCLAAGVQAMFAAGDFSLGIFGYVIMRVAHVGLLLRAANHNPDARTSSRFYAVGITLCQILWIVGFLYVPPQYIPLFFAIMVILEFSVPVAVSFFAEIPWHLGHITERYGLLVIIVLGESLLAVTWALQKITINEAAQWSLAAQIVGGMVAMFAMWWIYFGEKEFRALNSPRTIYVWSYGHVIVFGSIAAFGAGLAVNLDFITHHGHASQLAASASMAIPAAGYLLGTWLVHEQFNADNRAQLLTFPILILLTLAASFVPGTILLIAVLLTVAAFTKSLFVTSQ